MPTEHHRDKLIKFNLVKRAAHFKREILLAPSQTNQRTDGRTDVRTDLPPLKWLAVCEEGGTVAHINRMTYADFHTVSRLASG